MAARPHSDAVGLDTMVTTVGIHIGHDGGCAVCVDGEIVVAIAEERLVRKKYAVGWWAALRYCMDAASLRLSDVDLFVFSNAGKPLPKNYDGDLARWGQGEIRSENVDHHLSHAVGGFCLSGFPDALVFVADAGGNDGMTESFHSFTRTGHEMLRRSYPHRPRFRGLGTTYEAFTNFLGFADQESGKTMALASYGRPSRWSSPLFEVDALGQIRGALEAPHQWGVTRFAARVALPWQTPFPPTDSDIAQDVASCIQSELVRALQESLLAVLRETQATNIVMSGGVALNCAANSILRQSLPAKFYAFPACSDTGLAIGNALYGQWRLTGRFPNPSDKSMLYGKEYGPREIREALDREPHTVPPGSIRRGDLRFENSTDVAAHAAQLISEGKIVAWWQHRSESGPRALGARSLLASPNAPNMRDEINAKVKLREWFRPFGASVLRSEAEILVEPSCDYPFMVEAPRVRSEGFDQMRECIHVDGSSRIQTVSDASPSSYARLLKRLSEVRGSSVVLNTSFNINEPIVETPGDAIATFLRSGIDALVLDAYICTRAED